MRVIKGIYSKNFRGELQTNLYCNECNDNVSHALEIPNWDGFTIYLCDECIVKAYNLITAQAQKEIANVKANIDIMRGSEDDEGID